MVDHQGTLDMDCKVAGDRDAVGMVVGSMMVAAGAVDMCIDGTGYSCGSLVDKWAVDSSRVAVDCTDTSIDPPLLIGYLHLVYE